MTEEETTRQLLHVTAQNERAVELLEAARREFTDHAVRCRGMDELRGEITKFLKPTRPVECDEPRGRHVPGCEHMIQGSDKPMMIIEPEKK